MVADSLHSVWELSFYQSVEYQEHFAVVECSCFPTTKIVVVYIDLIRFQLNILNPSTKISDVNYTLKSNSLSPNCWTMSSHPLAGVKESFDKGQGWQFE